LGVTKKKPAQSEGLMWKEKWTRRRIPSKHKNGGLWGKGEGSGKRKPSIKKKKIQRKEKEKKARKKKTGHVPTESTQPLTATKKGEK